MSERKKEQKSQRQEGDRQTGKKMGALSSTLGGKTNVINEGKTGHRGNLKSSTGLNGGD